MFVSAFNSCLELECAKYSDYIMCWIARELGFGTQQGHISLPYLKCLRGIPSLLSSGYQGHFVWVVKQTILSIAKNNAWSYTFTPYMGLV
jgi:hypothetical protein